MENITFFLLRCLQTLLSVLGNAIVALVDGLNPSSAFDAKLGSERLVASRFNKGFYVSTKRLTRRASFSNLLLCGITGSGKSTKIIAKCLFGLRNCSMIVADPSKELYLCSGVLALFFRVIIVNFSDSTAGTGFNPLDYIKKDSDVSKIAHILVAASLDKGAASSDPFWSLQAKTCISLVIRLLRHQPPQFLNFANCLYLLECFSYPEKIDRLFARTGDERLLHSYKSFISTPEKTLLLVIASAKAALQPFENPEFAKTTAYSGVDFAVLRKKPTVVFLHNSIGDQRHASVLTSLFFEQFYNHVLQRLPNKDELDLFCILEEASSLYIPLLPLAVANCRKHRLGNLISVQSKNQLRTFYKEESESIASNCVHKLYLAGSTALDELREIEALSGKSVYKDKKTGTERVKPLLTADEIRLMPENRAILVSANHPVIKLRVTPYWYNLVFRKYAKMTPYKFDSDIPVGPLPLISI